LALAATPTNGPPARKAIHPGRARKMFSTVERDVMLVSGR